MIKARYKRGKIFTCFLISLLSFCLVFLPVFGKLTVIKSEALPVSLIKSGTKALSGGKGLIPELATAVGTLGGSVLEGLGLGFVGQAIGDIWEGIFGSSDFEENYQNWIETNNYTFAGNGSMYFPLVITGNSFVSSRSNTFDLLKSDQYVFLDFFYDDNTFSFFYNISSERISLVVVTQNFNFPYRTTYVSRGSLYKTYPNSSYIGYTNPSGTLEANNNLNLEFGYTFYTSSRSIQSYLFEGYVNFTPQILPSNAPVNTYISNLTNNYYDNSLNSYDYSINNTENKIDPEEPMVVLLDKPLIDNDTSWFQLPSINLPDKSIGKSITDLQLDYPTVDLEYEYDIDLSNVDDYITLPDGDIIPIEKTYNYDYSTRTFTVTSKDDNNIKYTIEYGENGIDLTKINTGNNSVETNTYYYYYYQPEIEVDPDNPPVNPDNPPLNPDNPDNNTSGGGICVSCGTLLPDTPVDVIIKAIMAPVNIVMDLIDGLANAVKDLLENTLELMSDVTGYTSLFMDYVRSWFSWLPAPVQTLLMSGFAIFFTVSIFRLFRGG